MLGQSFDRLLRKNHEVIVTDSKIDISDTFRVIEWAKVNKADIIINCAAYTDVDGAEIEVEKSWRVNSNGPMNIAIAAGIVGATPVHFSTDYVFDGKAQAGYKEEDKANPINHYGFTKQSGEMRFCSISNDCFIVRTSWLFGYTGHNFLKTMLQLFRTKKELKVVDDQFGRPTYVDDLAKMTCELLFGDTYQGGVINVTNSSSGSWFDFACCIQDKAYELGMIREKIRIIPVNTKDYRPIRRAERPMNSVLDLKRVEENLADPIPPWFDAVERCLKVIKEIEFQESRYG